MRRGNSTINLGSIIALLHSFLLTVLLTSFCLFRLVMAANLPFDYYTHEQEPLLDTHYASNTHSTHGGPLEGTHPPITSSAGTNLGGHRAHGASISEYAQFFEPSLSEDRGDPMGFAIGGFGSADMSTGHAPLQPRRSSQNVLSSQVSLGFGNGVASMSSPPFYPTQALSAAQSLMELGSVSSDGSESELVDVHIGGASGCNSPKPTAVPKPTSSSYPPVPGSLSPVHAPTGQGMEARQGLTGSGSLQSFNKGPLYSRSLLHLSSVDEDGSSGNTYLLPRNSFMS